MLDPRETAAIKPPDEFGGQIFSPAINSCRAASKDCGVEKGAVLVYNRSHGIAHLSGDET